MQTCEVCVAHGRGARLRYIHCHLVTTKLGEEYSKGIFFVHHVSDIDIVLKIYGIGKNNSLCRKMQHTSSQTCLCSPGKTYKPHIHGGDRKVCGAVISSHITSGPCQRSQTYVCYREPQTCEYSTNQRCSGTACKTCYQAGRAGKA